MITFLLIVLSAAVSGFAVAWLYEREMRQVVLKEWHVLSDEYNRLAGENATNREALAQEEGIGIGRECDAVQRRMADGLKHGRRVQLHIAGEEEKQWKSS